MPKRKARTGPVSVTGSEFVETAHGVTLKADLKIEDADLSDADMLLLPGGLMKMLRQMRTSLLTSGHTRK